MHNVIPLTEESVWHTLSFLARMHVRTSLDEAPHSLLYIIGSVVKDGSGSCDLKCPHHPVIHRYEDHDSLRIRRLYQYP
jgi:hypothetical protein